MGKGFIRIGQCCWNVSFFTHLTETFGQNSTPGILFTDREINVFLLSKTDHNSQSTYGNRQVEIFPYMLT